VQTPSGSTALMKATTMQRKPIVIILLQFGSDLSIKNNDNQNVFDIAKFDYAFEMWFKCFANNWTYINHLEHSKKFQSFVFNMLLLRKVKGTFFYMMPRHVLYAILWHVPTASYID
jgi:hypothetical protein